MITRAFRIIGILGPLALPVLGCSVAGDWHRVATEPPGAPFPLERLMLDKRGNYSAFFNDGGRKGTSAGTYRWDGLSLSFTQMGSEPFKYGARLSLDGKLRLSLRLGKHKLTAVMERATEPSQQPAGDLEVATPQPPTPESATAPPKTTLPPNATTPRPAPSPPSEKP